jgi:hypothetical protein
MKLTPETIHVRIAVLGPPREYGYNPRSKYKGIGILTEHQYAEPHLIKQGPFYDDYEILVTGIWHSPRDPEGTGFQVKLLLRTLPETTKSNKPPGTIDFVTGTGDTNGFKWTAQLSSRADPEYAAAYIYKTLAKDLTGKHIQDLL